jgi:hypothetical protein
MSLIDSLRKIAQTLRIIQVAPAAAAPDTAAAKAQAKIETRSCTLAELMSEIRSEEVRALADAPAELTVALEKVCETAGVKAPNNGWTVDKLRDVLRTDKFKNLSRNHAQRALIEQFAAEKVDVQQLVKDAVARDQAIDAFAKFARDKMQSRRQARQSQIEQLQQQLDRLKHDGEQEEQQWQQWQKRKKEYEKEMAWAIGYLLDNPIITQDD